MYLFLFIHVKPAFAYIAAQLYLQLSLSGGVVALNKL